MIVDGKLLLIEEANRSSKRFKVKVGDALEIIDTKRGQTSKFDVLGEAESAERELLKMLVTVANQQNDDYDPLLNAVEELDAIIIFLKTRFPQIRHSNVLRPLMTLHGAVQDCVVGAKPELIYDRSPKQNGAYRWGDNVPDGFAKGSRPLRTSKEMLQGLILVAYKALLAGHAETDADDALKKLLNDNEVGLVNDKHGTGPSTIVIKKWWKRLHEEGRKPAMGRSYSFENVCELYKGRLAASVDPAVGLHLAAELIDRVRFHQPTGWYVPSRHNLSV